MNSSYFKKPRIVLLTGASGCGKTTVAKALAQRLSRKAACYYFDDIGVPSNKEMLSKFGAPLKWQEWAIHSWIEKLARITAKELVILEGSFYPHFAVSKMTELGISNYLIISLFVERRIRERRLIEDRHQPELVHQDMENYAHALREETESLGGVNVGGSKKSMAEIVDEIISLIGGIPDFDSRIPPVT